MFIVGGPWGHGDAVLARADTKVSLSGCVLNHAVARLLLSEQLYRAWTILRGERGGKALQRLVFCWRPSDPSPPIVARRRRVSPLRRRESGASNSLGAFIRGVRSRLRSGGVHDEGRLNRHFEGADEDAEATGRDI